MLFTFFLFIIFLESERNPKKECNDEINNEKNNQLELNEVNETSQNNSNDGWDDDEYEKDVDSNWNTVDEVEEVYNYGSTFVQLLDDDGKPVPTLAELSNRVIITKTAFQHLCFTDQEPGKNNRQFFYHQNIHI